MKKCKYCQSEIDEKAKICPNCKQDLRNYFEQHKFLTVILVLFILGLIGSNTAINLRNSMQTSTEENKKSNGIEEASKSNSNKEKQYINIGESVSAKDWEINVVEVKFDQRINPPTQPMYYQYYQVKDTNNTYLCVVLDCKNISTLELGADEIAIVKVKYNNNYTYSSFSTVEDGTLGFTYSNITNIDPLTNKKVYYLAEMPKNIADETDTPVEVEIKINNNIYYYKVR